jgi:hypothetical protein
MNKSGPIIIVEDDMDDQEILVDIFKELNYNVVMKHLSANKQLFASPFPQVLPV